MQMQTIKGGYMDSKATYEEVEFEVVEFEAADIVAGSPEGDVL